MTVQFVTSSICEYLKKLKKLRGDITHMTFCMSNLEVESPPNNNTNGQANGDPEMNTPKVFHDETNI